MSNHKSTFSLMTWKNICLVRYKILTYYICILSMSICIHLHINTYICTSPRRSPRVILAVQLLCICNVATWLVGLMSFRNVKQRISVRIGVNESMQMNSSYTSCDAYNFLCVAYSHLLFSFHKTLKLFSKLSSKRTLCRVVKN